jgi:hypothetical protein
MNGSVLGVPVNASTIVLAAFAVVGLATVSRYVKDQRADKKISELVTFDRFRTAGGGGFNQITPAILRG